MIYQDQQILRPATPVNVCPKTSLGAGVSSFGDFVFSIVTAEASKSAIGVLEREYLRHDRTRVVFWIAFNEGEKPNRDRKDREKARLSMA